MRSFPRVHRRVLGTWLCLLFLLSLVSHETGDASPTTSIIPFLTTIPPFTKLLRLIVEPSAYKAQIRTWKERSGRYGSVGILALAVVGFSIFLAANAIEPLIVKAVDKHHGAVLKTRLRVSEFRKGLCRQIAGFTTRCLIATGFIRPQFVSERLLTPKDSPRKAERWQRSLNRPSAGFVLFPIPCSPQKKLAPKSSETGLPIEEIIKALNEPFTDRRDKKPVGPPHLLASSPITSKTTLEVASNLDSFPVYEKTEKEDVLALNPSAPNSSGIVPSAQISGPMPDAGSLGALKLDSSCSVPLATVDRLRAILCADIPSLTSQPSKPNGSGAALSAQVSGSAPQTGFLRKRLEVEAAVPSANHSRMIARADIDRIENANRTGKSNDRKRGGVTIARRGPALLETIAEDLEDSAVSSNTPTVVTVSASSIRPQATINTAIQPPADADEQKSPRFGCCSVRSSKRDGTRDRFRRQVGIA